MSSAQHAVTARGRGLRSRRAARRVSPPSQRVLKRLVHKSVYKYWPLICQFPASYGGPRTPRLGWSSRHRPPPLRSGRASPIKVRAVTADRPDHGRVIERRVEPDDDRARREQLGHPRRTRERICYQSVKLSQQRHTSARSLRQHVTPGQDQSCSIQDLTSCRSTTDYENLQLMAPVSERPGPGELLSRPGGGLRWNS
jgi:hypothetical protein